MNFNNLLVTRLLDKTSSVGAVISTMGCAMCFPAIASLGGALGLGFLEQWEWIFINTLLPIFAGIAIFVNGLGWLSHRQLSRTLIAFVGPVLLLLSLYPLFQYRWSPYVTYTALGIMIAVSIWDLYSPANRHCPTGETI